jgi:hypothetical protein
MTKLSLRWPIALIVGCVLFGCAKPDPTVILGKWKADSFAFDSLKFPLAPNIEVTRNELLLLSPDGSLIQALPLAQIRAEKDTVEIELKDALGISLIFKVESANRVHFRVPVIGADLAYTKL